MKGTADVGSGERDEEEVEEGEGEEERDLGGAGITKVGSDSFLASSYIQCEVITENARIIDFIRRGMYNH